MHAVYRYRIDGAGPWHLYDTKRRSTACGVAARPSQLGRGQVVSDDGRCGTCEALAPQPAKARR